MQTHVKIGRSEAGLTYEADAVATEGIDDIPGPVIIELCLAAPSPHRVKHDIARIDNVIQYANAKSAILIFGRRMQGATKSAIRRTLSNGAQLLAWDEVEINKLVSQYPEDAERIAANIDAIRLDNIVKRSSTATIDDWKGRRAEHLRELRCAYQDNELALFLGAGVSLEAGVPSWDSLLNGMLARLVRRRNSSVATDDEVHEIVRRLRVVDNPSPLMAARYLRRGLADNFISEVIDLLYNSIARNKKDPRLETHNDPTGAASTLAVLARLCIPRRSGPGVSAVVTYNFDDLFEKQLEAVGVAHRPIFYEGDFEGKDELAVYHVHGFLPQDPKKYKDGAAHFGDLIFSEEGYHRLLEDPYSWANLVQLGLFRNATCLMVGLSLTDPNLRRLLEVSARRNGRLFHYAFMRRVGVNGFMKANDGATAVSAREDAVERFLSIHHEIQDELFAELGVRILWVENFAEIPILIRSIAATATGSS